MSHGQVMFDLLGLTLSAEEREMLRHPAAGGVILFSRNYASPEQLCRLIEQIHEASAHTLIAVDQEGGRVQRFREGFSGLPPMARLGVLYDSTRAHALHTATSLGWLMASELRAVGVDFSFAPVLDLGVGISEVIGDRAFHAQPMAVARLAGAWMKGMHDAGMPAVGKHFPGHGRVAADSHVDLPIDDRDLVDLEFSDLQPFQILIGNGLDAIMPAHVIYARVDDKPAGFSRFWLRDVLRRRMNFQGCIFSDDLSMAAAKTAGGFAERAEAALLAGCDMVLVCNNRDAAVEVLDALKTREDPVAQTRIARMHGRGHVTRRSLQQDNRYPSALAELRALQDLDAFKLEMG